MSIKRLYENSQNLMQNLDGELTKRLPDTERLCLESIREQVRQNTEKLLQLYINEVKNAKH